MLKAIEKPGNVATAGIYCLLNMGPRAGRLAFNGVPGDMTHLYMKASKLAQTVETKLYVIVLKIWEVSRRYA
jgi:hypothetical protein